MYKKIIYSKYTKYAIAAIFSLIIIAFFLNRQGSEDYKVDISSGWMMYDSLNIKGVKDINITEDNVAISEKGDKIVLAQNVTKKMDNPALFFRTYHSAVKVYIENECIYKNGIEEYKEGSVVGCGYHLIALPDNYIGKKLVISIQAAEKNAFATLEPICIVDTQKFIYGYIKDNLISLMITFFLMMIGVVAIITSLIIGLNKSYVRKIAYIGLLSMILGIWTQCYYGFINLICQNVKAIYYLEHLSLFTLGIPIILFYYESINEGTLKKIFEKLFVINIVFIAVACCLNALNIAHFNGIISVYHIFAFVTIICSVIAIFSNRMSNRKSRSSMIIGVISLAVVLIIEMVEYNIRFFLIQGENNKMLVPLGGLIYISCSIIAHLFMLIDSLEEKAREKALVVLAYGDTLTGLSNRKCCEDKMTQIDKDNVKEFGIINFDLNWLKKINDGIGHIKGDEYLCEFASLLKKCCGNKATVGRMGGDEFIAIFENVTEKDLDDVLKEMNRLSGNGNMPETREIGSGISFAYGYSVSTSSMPITTTKAYEIADEKMYECKKKQKVGRK